MNRVITSLYSPFLRPWLEYCSQFWALWCNKNVINWSEVGMGDDPKKPRGLEHLPCKERLRKLGMLSLERRWLGGT